MTKKKLELYWRSNPEWWHIEGSKQILNKNAPIEAKKSYQIYLKQISKLTKKERIL